MTSKAHKRVLVADDDPDLRDILRSVLEPAGFAVTEAADGAQALEAVCAEPPDLVILQVDAPGVDIPTISRWLGHSDGGALAMRVYGHLRQEHSNAMIKRVSFDNVETGVSVPQGAMGQATV